MRNEPAKTQLEKHGRHAWDFLWDWKKESKRHLEIGFRFAKRHPFSVFALVLVTCILTWLAVGHFNSKTLDSVKGAYQSTNSFLEGQVSSLTGQLKIQKEEHNRKIIEDATTLANVKSDYNEQLRSKDVEIQKMTEARDSALQRIAIMEAMPAGLLSIYTNLAAIAPTNLNQLTSFLQNLTNSAGKDLIIPKFKLILNKQLYVTETPTPNVIISTNRSLFFTILNDSDMTAEKLTVTFQANLDSTHFLSTHDWDINRYFIDDQNQKIWTMEADKIVSGHTRFNATTFEISTNYTKIDLDAVVTIFSSASKVQTYQFKFLYGQVVGDSLKNITALFPNINIQAY